jgi:putative PIN family toxin of toxin-antitoxin system
VRIVFDTNVLFSAFITHGACAGLYEECLQRAQIVVSPDILEELEEKLVLKARLSAAEAREVIRAVRADAEVVKPAPLPGPVCRDADDDLILAAALAAKADAIVTGDQDLLVLKEYDGIPILNPRDCLALLTTA